jgi:uncharacterized membrane protein YvbJ
MELQEAEKEFEFQIAAIRSQSETYENYEETDATHVIQCKKCGFLNDDDDNFCLKCGSKIERFSNEIQNQRAQQKGGKLLCAACGGENDEDNIFCCKCGSKLGSEQKTAFSEKKDVTAGKKPDDLQALNTGVSNEADFTHGGTDNTPPAAPKCPKCNADLEEDALFCSECGFRIQDKERENDPDRGLRCSNCGYQNDPDTVFCIECGYKFK